MIGGKAIFNRAGGNVMFDFPDLIQSDVFETGFLLLLQWLVPTFEFQPKGVHTMLHRSISPEMDSL